MFIAIRNSYDFGDELSRTFHGCRGSGQYWQSGQAEAKSDMGFAGAAIAERDNVLTPFDIFATRQFQNHHLVERWDGLEVEAVETFDGRELGLSDPPLDHATLPVDEFQLGQANQISHMINPLGGTLASQLIVFPEEGGQSERLQMMGQQELWRITHDAALANKVI